MQVLTSIGEQGVQVGERFVKFRPSLAAMGRIGTPREVVETFVAVCGTPALSGNPWLDEPRVKLWRKEQFSAALTVLYCCTDEPIDWLVGYINERFRYVRGVLPLADIVGLAIGLLKHGIMGDLPPEATRGAKKSDYLSEFKARDFATAAMAHLDATEAEAWDMTMTSYIGAMRAKYPPPKDAKQTPSEEEFVHVKNWLAKIKQARAGAAKHG